MAGGILLQSAQTTGNGSAVDCRGEEGEYVFSVQGNGTTSGGAVQFEEALDPTYTGTWAPIDAAVAPVSNGLAMLKITGAFRAVRARISSNITGGGTVTCRVQPPLLGM